jgi:exodeoxyribonuclease VII large subunit
MPAVSAQPAHAAAAPLSIRDVAGLIQDQLRPLAIAGRRIVHAQWIKPGINAGARGFLSVTLADSQDTNVSIDGFIWERADVQAVLEQGKAFGCDLADREGRCEVMLEVTIDFWAKRTKPYLRIHSLNQIGMKGLRHQQREATLARLKDGDLIDRNKAVRWARPALRVLCIAKRDSDGCRDALAILSKSGFRFQSTIHHVAVQGMSAVPSIVAAFEEVVRRHADFDVVLLIRGGGSELDLMAYDEYSVAEAVARCPLPVVTGLGHTADHSVCDVVSAKALETPTAAARFLVDRVQDLHDNLQHTAERLRAAAFDQLHHRRRMLLDQRPSFVRCALSLAYCVQQRRAQQWHAVLTAVQHGLHDRRRWLQQVHQPIPLHARRLWQTHRTWLNDRFRAVMSFSPILVMSRRGQLRLWRQSLPLSGLNTLVGPARLRLRAAQQRVHQMGCDAVRRAYARLHKIHAHIQAASPDRYFALGLSFVTRPDGKLVRHRADVQAGDAIKVHLTDGTVPAVVTEKEV